MSEHPSGISPTQYPEPFADLYRRHLQHLQLKGLRPKTVDAYARAMRRIGAHFDFEVCALSPAHLSDYFSAMLRQHAWSGVKLDLYGLKFFTQHVLGQPWAMPRFIRPPKVSRLLPTPTPLAEPPPTRPVWRCACGQPMVILRRRVRADAMSALSACTAPQMLRPDKPNAGEVTKH